MSSTKNTNNQNADAVENENVESAESEVEIETTGEPTEDTTEEPTVEEPSDDTVAEQNNVEVDADEEYEEIEQMEADKTDAEIEQDHGFDQQQEPVANNSGGKGMAGTAMVMSLLALAGTGYNWYDTKSLKTGQATSDEQTAVDYSEQIASLEQQIQSLTQSQEKLSAMAVATTESSAVEEAATTVAGDAEDSTSGLTDTTEAEVTDEQTEVAQTETDTESEETVSSDQTDVAEQSEQVAESEESAETEVVAETEQVSETLAAEVEESSAAQQDDVVESEVSTTESEAEEDAESVTAAEQVVQASDGETEVMSSASVPSGEDIKQIAMQQVDEVLADAKKRLGLNEVAQLLSIGEQRLSLAGDVAAAQTAFGLADERLAALSDPIVAPVRESIADNIESLSAVELVDKNALTQDLGNLAVAVDSLAFKPLETLADEQALTAEVAVEEETTAQAEQTSSETESEGLSIEGAGNLIKSWGSKLGDTIGEVGSGIAGDLKNMVRIKKTGPMSDVVLAPEQEYFIRENMKLMLGGAQRAVLQSNGGVYQQNLNQAQSLLGEFFDPENEDVQSVASRLADLGQINIDPELPDISNASASLSEVLKQLATADSNN